MRVQKAYDGSKIYPEEKLELNKDAIFKNIYTDYQVEGKKKTITYSEPSSSIVDKDCQTEQEKTNGINNLEMHQKEEIDKPVSNPNDNLRVYSDKSHQGSRTSGTNSNLREGTYDAMKEKIVSNENATSLDPEKGFNKPIGTMKQELTAKKDIECSFQARKIHEMKRSLKMKSSLGINTILEEEAHQIETQIPGEINKQNIQQNVESSKTNNNADINLVSETSSKG